MNTAGTSSGLRIVVVTDRTPHQKNLCVKLAQKYNVVGIIHPKDEPRGFSAAWKKLRRQLRQNGAATVLMHALKGMPAGSWRIPGRPVPDSPDFQQAVSEYERFDRGLIFESCDVKSEETIGLLRSLKPDVTVCLGGPIYPKAFIEASPLMLNFHSGISPIYNGAASIHYAFANGHAHLCGGTLMVMNAAVDGGGILGHYLPAIKEGDTPQTLFDRTVDGAVGMYSRVIESVSKHQRLLPSVPQPPPLFYTRGPEYGWHHKAMIAARCRANLAGRKVRPEKIIEYWRAPDAAAAAAACRQTIDALLWGGPITHTL